MSGSVIYKKVIYFLLVAGSITIALLAVSALEGGENVKNFVLRSTMDLGATEMVAGTIVSLVENLLHIAKIILWMALVIATIRLVAWLIFETLLKNTAQSEIASLARTILSVVIYIVAFFIIFQSQYPSVNLGAIFTGSAIVGIVVGLALQDTLGNLFAGIALQADKPFQVGDVISISNRGTGTIESVSWRGVRIRTFQNKLLIISNAVLGKETIEVAARNNLNAHIVHFNTVFYNSPAKTAQVVREAVRQVENVSPKRRPIVRIASFGESSINWEIKYWPERYAGYNDTDALIRQRIWYAFQREGIEFAYPTRTVHMVKPVEEKTADERIGSITETLVNVPIFAPLSEHEIHRLAGASHRRVFAPGEAIVRMGKEGSSMFVISRGSVTVRIAEEAETRIVNNLSANDFFGEMSLLTGEPRTASVIAEEETEVFQIRKASIKPLFEANPDLMNSISEIVEERRRMLAEGPAPVTESSPIGESSVIKSIRRFFGFRG